MLKMIAGILRQQGSNATPIPRFGYRSGSMESRSRSFGYLRVKADSGHLTPLESVGCSVLN